MNSRLSSEKIKLSDTHTNVVRHSHEYIHCTFFSVTVTVRYVQTLWSWVWCSYMGGPQLRHSWSWANVPDTSIKGGGGGGAAWNRSGLNTKNSLNTQELDRAHRSCGRKSSSRLNYTTKWSPQPGDLRQYILRSGI